ncbi:hypothetical protein BpHYR1_023516 [Brachionus plicatilis]|uniref:Uncharacterized protein n=1 Tax=Brachionus plicatilis TaxID=10195 RepID=A0A3M7R9S8_BRAPC|nr:hypothetical protein BpHYR1_023516 [Brachionus plicatilis]
MSFYYKIKINLAENICNTTYCLDQGLDNKTVPLDFPIHPSTLPSLLPSLVVRVGAEKTLLIEAGSRDACETHLTSTHFCSRH